MKNPILLMAIAIVLFACNTPQATSTTTEEDPNITAFKENSKITLSVFEAFANKDLNTWETFLSDSLKSHGAQYGGEATVTKEVLRQRLEGFHKLFNNIKPNDILFLPGVDTVTYKPNGDVRAYVRWTDDAALNGAKIEHKYYGVFKFNKDHKMIDTDEYFDVSGAIKAATDPKK